VWVCVWTLTAVIPAEEPWRLRLRSGLEEHHAFLESLNEETNFASDPDEVAEALRFYKSFDEDSAALGASPVVQKGLAADGEPAGPPGGYMFRAEVDLDGDGGAESFYALSSGNWLDSPLWVGYAPDGRTRGGLEFVGRVWRRIGADGVVQVTSVIAGQPVRVLTYRVTPEEVKLTEEMNMEEGELVAAGATGDAWEEALARHRNLGEPIAFQISKARVGDLVFGAPARIDSPAVKAPGLGMAALWSAVDPNYDLSEQHIPDRADRHKSFISGLDGEPGASLLTRRLLELGLIDENWSGLAPSPGNLEIVFSDLAPLARDGDDELMAGSAAFQGFPQINRLVEGNHLHRVAYREFTVQLTPVATFAKSTVTIVYNAEVAGQNLGALPKDFSQVIEPNNGIQVPLDENARARIRVNCPPYGLNRIDLTIKSDKENVSLERRARFVNPMVVVIDPGHGGRTDVPGSSANNAKGGATGTLEKAMALRLGLAVRDALRDRCESQGIPVRVLTTRAEDRNVRGDARASVAKMSGADRFLVIHFNASESHKARGTLQVLRSRGEVNRSEDDVYARRILGAVVKGLKPFDSGACVRDDVTTNTTVANDSLMGNVTGYHPVRFCYLETEFIDNPRVDRLLNEGETSARIHQSISAAVAEATLEDMIGGRKYEGE
jgi:N-acetylmuramoyl-L-alanine amidase